MYHEAQSPLEVESSAILGLNRSNQFLLYPQQLCHSSKGCALPSLLLSLKGGGKGTQRQIVGGDIDGDIEITQMTAAVVLGRATVCSGTWGAAGRADSTLSTQAQCS